MKNKITPSDHELKPTKIRSTIIGGTGISCKEKNRKENFKMNVSLSFHNYKIVFKVRISSPLQTSQLMVPIGKKPAPGDHESCLKIFLAKLFLARCPCALLATFLQKEDKRTIMNNYSPKNSNEKSQIYIFDSDLVWRIQLMIIKG